MYTGVRFERRCALKLQSRFLLTLFRFNFLGYRANKTRIPLPRIWMLTALSATLQYLNAVKVRLFDLVIVLNHSFIVAVTVKFISRTENCNRENAHNGLPSIHPLFIMICRLFKNRPIYSMSAQLKEASSGRSEIWVQFVVIKCEFPETMIALTRKSIDYLNVEPPRARNWDQFINIEVVFMQILLNAMNEEMNSQVFRVFKY